MKYFLFIFLTFNLLIGCAHTPQKEDSAKILSITDVKWEKLNPARGSQSPQAATLWGDRKGSTATGFLAKFVDGFSSPPHIHNVSYKAIVIKGLIHNDDPKAEKMWMPKSSYWTQPAGEAHITSAKGQTNIALVEIDHGPYLVKSTKENFDNNERPFNIHSSNIIWKVFKGVKVADMWKNKEGRVTGSMVKFKNSLKLDSENTYLVLIAGSMIFQKQSLMPGSLIKIDKKTRSYFSCTQESECILYIKSDKNFKLQR